MRLFFALGFILLAGDALAQTRRCQESTIFEFYNGLKKSNPIQSQIQKRIKQANSLVDLAKQRPNPQFDFEYLKGNQFGIDLNNINASIKHVIEFGSKRSKRIDRARVESEIQKKQLFLEGLATNVSYVLKYQRYAQLEILIEATKEAIDTFDGAVRRLQGRSGLNPEERVSLSTLRLAAGDYKARLNDLENEKTLLSGDLSFIANCEDLKPTYAKLNYDKISGALRTSENTSSGLITIQKLKEGYAEADLNIQRSLGYSNIYVGPIIEYQTQGQDRFVSGGVALSFDLPLFHTNDGGKENALRNYRAQKLESVNTINNLTIKQLRLVNKYLRSVKVLSEMPKLSTLEKQHIEVEKLFSRGIVSIPMTIESHRQHIDFLESRFETENDLLVSLEEIIFIKGNTQLLEDLFRAGSTETKSKDKR